MNSSGPVSIVPGVFKFPPSNCLLGIHPSVGFFLWYLIPWNPFFWGKGWTRNKGLHLPAFLPKRRPIYRAICTIINLNALNLNKKHPPTKQKYNRKQIDKCCYQFNDNSVEIEKDKILMQARCRILEVK